MVAAKKLVAVVPPYGPLTPSVVVVGLRLTPTEVFAAAAGDEED